jgi:hypothetical protein
VYKELIAVAFEAKEGVMQRRFVITAVVLLASGIAPAAQLDKAADLPYAGKWKLNVAKSDFGETTVTFAQTASGEMQFTAAGQSYTFRMDGKDYPGLFGRTATWKQIDANTWETANKQDGKLLSTETTKLSADGKTLSINAKGPKPAGGTFDQTIVYERVSGGPGLVGKWKTKNVETSAPTVLELTPSGSDGLTVNIPDFKITSEVKFDGKDYPAVGPGVPPGLTLAIQKAGPRSFDMTEKQNGKPLFKLSFTVSADGKTLTETGGPIGVSEKFKAVYDRQ